MSSSTTDPYQAVRRRVAKLLVGFTPSGSATSAAVAMSAYRPERRNFPVPELVLFTLRNLMGWPWQGKGEKVRWTLYGSTRLLASARSAVRSVFHTCSFPHAAMRSRGTLALKYQFALPLRCAR